MYRDNEKTKISLSAFDTLLALSYLIISLPSFHFLSPLPPLSLSLFLFRLVCLFCSFSFYRRDVPVGTTTMLEKTGLLQAPALERRILVVLE